MSRLLEQYRTKILPVLREELKLPDSLAVPRIGKIVINAGIGKPLSQQPKALDNFVRALSQITGQKPVITRARQAISGFKTRIGQTVGLAVTLRGKRMYEFLDKLINITFPRTRDFRGLSRKSFDGHGNYAIGMREHLVFPEMAQEDIEGVFGLQVNIVTNAGDDDKAYLLLKKFGFPFKD